MKTILSAVITCAVLFGVSAGATKYLTDQSAAATEETDENAGEAETGDAANESATEDGGVQGLPPQSMPVSFRPEAQVSVEAVLQMSDSIKRMEQDLAKREEKVRRDEKRVKLMFDDLATEQDQIRAFSEGLESKLELVTRTKEQLEETLAQLDERKNEMEKPTL